MRRDGYTLLSYITFIILQCVTTYRIAFNCMALNYMFFPLIITFDAMMFAVRGLD